MIKKTNKTREIKKINDLGLVLLSNQGGVLLIFVGPKKHKPSQLLDPVLPRLRVHHGPCLHETLDL